MSSAVLNVVCGTISDGSAFGGLISALGALLAFQLALVRDRALSLSITIPSIAGLTLSLIGIVFSVPVLKYLALALAVIGIAVTVIVLRKASLPSSLIARLPRSALAKGALATAALAAAVAIGVAIGSLLSDGSSPNVVVTPGPYHVENTCFDGICTVNVCEEPRPCGEDHIDTLREGIAIEIKCQTSGGVVHGSAGEESRIWDRLSSGFYVSDLFVGETRHGRFTPTIPHCTDE